jgi:hypothetical protein
MLDSIGSVTMGDSFKRCCVGTELKYAIVPKKCHISGKTICMENAYKQTAMLLGPGDVMFEDRWYKKNEFIIAKLKGIV